MRTLLIDNYDSFTYNLYQLITVVTGYEPTVVRNDEVHDIADLRLGQFSNVVISPGPGHPGVERDFGISAAVIAEANIPLLGVCLGHQGIVIDAGGRVDYAPQPRHGYADYIEHDDDELFAGIPSGFAAVRYHSLAAGLPLPDALEVTARASDGVVMGVRHRWRPQWGVQFHPESIASEYGKLLLANFTRLSGGSPRRLPVPSRAPAGPPQSRFRLNVTRIDRAIDTEAIFAELYSTAKQSFWLDSEHVEPGLDRFSFLGDAHGPLAETVQYQVGTNEVLVTQTGQEPARHSGTIFSYLSAQLAIRTLPVRRDLPFDFQCGYAGYFGYELKAETLPVYNRHQSDIPDAQWIFADRMVVVDHLAGATYLLALDDWSVQVAAAAHDWLAATSEALKTLPTWVNPDPEPAPEQLESTQLSWPAADYLAGIAECQRQLRAGESYEICLTNSVRFPDDGAGGLAFYRSLRRRNPAPYAAYLCFGAVEVACTSPERFLKIDREQVVESKPIKGTAARSPDPVADAALVAELAASTKTRAENLMIVDLLRNDLGRVCEPGSVTVPSLMAVETYSTLHQLVSTVRGRLRPEVNAISCVRACFPGGSMTGAPKLRTLEILDGLESDARGIYSGAIGFLSLGGTADLNIVIRTAVLHNGYWKIGTGGAIVLDSDPEAELAEVLLKAGAVTPPRPT